MSNFSDDDLQHLHQSKRDVQLDNVISFIKKYKIILALSMMLIISVVGGFFGYQSYQNHRLIQLIDDYQTAQINISSQKYEKPLTNLINIVNDSQLPDFYLYSAVNELINVYFGHRYLLNDLAYATESGKEEYKEIFTQIRQTISSGISRVENDMWRTLLIANSDFVNKYQEKMYNMLGIKKIEIPDLTHTNSRQLYLSESSMEVQMFMHLDSNEYDQARKLAQQIISSPTKDQYRKRRAESILLYLLNKN